MAIADNAIKLIDIQARVIENNIECVSEEHLIGLWSLNKAVTFKWNSERMHQGTPAQICSGKMPIQYIYYYNIMCFTINFGYSGTYCTFTVQHLH